VSDLKRLDYTEVKLIATIAGWLNEVLMMSFLKKQFFITGFPGFIASRLIKRLAAEGVRFILLVQPALLERAREEVEQIARETRAARADFQIVEGDITHDDLGMTTVELETARRETTNAVSPRRDL